MALARENGHVASTTNDLDNSSLDGGWAELGKGHWDVALDCFERAVAKEESPEGFEGLSWAAWWLDDAEVVFAARNRAYHLYKQRGHARTRLAGLLRGVPPRASLR